MDNYEGVYGIVSYNDLITFSIINAYNSVNYKLPHIFSFDISLISNAFPSVVITIGHRKEELGILAASKMINMLEGKKKSLNSLIGLYDFWNRKIQ